MGYRENVESLMAFTEYTIPQINAQQRENLMSNRYKAKWGIKLSLI